MSTPKHKSQGAELLPRSFCGRELILTPTGPKVALEQRALQDASPSLEYYGDGNFVYTILGRVVKLNLPRKPRLCRGRKMFLANSCLVGAGVRNATYDILTCDAPIEVDLAQAFPGCRFRVFHGPGDLGGLVVVLQVRQDKSEFVSVVLHPKGCEEGLYVTARDWQNLWFTMDFAFRDGSSLIYTDAADAHFFGRWLGFAECCASKFQEDRLKGQLPAVRYAEECRSKGIEPLVRPVKEGYESKSILTHVPCKAGAVGACPATLRFLRMAKKRLEGFHWATELIPRVEGR